MKNPFLYLSVCFALLATTMAASAQNLTIVGDVSKVKHKIRKVVFGYSVDGRQKTDSALVKNNRYTIAVVIDEDQNIPVTAIYENPENRTDYRADYVAIRVSPGTQATSEHAALFSERVVKGSVAEDEFSKIDLQLRAGELNVEGYLRENPDSRIAFTLMSFIFGPRPIANQVESLVSAMSERNRNSPSARKLLQRMSAIKNTTIGNQVPPIVQMDAEGKSVGIGDFKGKYVLIEFWASWCGPCREESPNLVKTYAEYKNKGFEILGISVDTQRKNWLAAVARDQMTWINTADLRDERENPAAVAFGVSSIPTNFLVDPDGKIIAKNLVGVALSEKLAEIFKGR